MHLTLCWPSSSTLFVTLTLVDSVTSKCYLCKLTVIIHGPIWRLLLSVTIPCQERKSIVRLVNFLLTFEFVQSKSYSLGEVYLKVSLPYWWDLLNCNPALNCAGLSRRFSSQTFKIESMFLIRLAKGSHSWPYSEHDDILLEIRNRYKESCVCSLVVTTGPNLAIISPPHCQTLVDTSVTMFVPSPFIMT
jgi:hypothetical protein